MPLPKIDVITYSVKIPSTNQEILIRPFLVKEQKILLTAIAGSDSLEMSSAVKQVINNCIVTPGVNVEKLQIFDIEYLMLQLRIVSVGETTKIAFTGIEKSDCPECKTKKEIEINLKEIKVVGEIQLNKKVELTETIGVFVKYPSHKEIALYSKYSGEENAELKLLWNCIESVYDSDKVVSSKDVTVEEGIEFLELLTTQQFKKIEGFLENMPQLSHDIKISCSTCGKEQLHTIRGLDSFLA